MTTLRTIDRPTSEPPRLDSGDRMDAETFLALYEQTPEGFRAQLVRGVVLHPSATTADHGAAVAKALGWLCLYGVRTPGVRGCAATTIRLGPDDTPEPDASLLILPECSGQSRIEGKYLAGAPELLVEVAYSSRAVDLHDKRVAYEAAGVREYVVVDLRDRVVHWLALRDGRFEAIAPEDDGLHRSEVFPGLWLDPKALVEGDSARLLAAVERGTASPEHAAFVERLAAARQAAGG